MQYAIGSLSGRTIVVVTGAEQVDLSELQEVGDVVIETTTPELLLKHLRHALASRPYERPPSWAVRDRDK